MTKNIFDRQTLRLALMASVIAGVIVPSILSQEKNPFSGSWKANISKSQRHPNHLFKSLTMRIEVSDDAVVLNYSGVNMSGAEESGTSKLQPDGKEHQIPEAPRIVQVSRWISARVLETVARKDGQVVGESTYEVSIDGKTLTARIKGMDATGATFEQVVVFDRE